MASPNPTTVRARNRAAYILRLTHPSGKTPDPGLPGVRKGELRLPLSPQSINYDAAPRQQVYPTGVSTAGADVQGKSPPVITIAGTFGERGSMALRMDGREWHRALEAFVEWYLVKVAEEGRARQPQHELEWHDTYRDEHWVVTPLNVPYGAQDASAPRRESYTLRLQGLREADRDRQEPDTLARALNNPLSACPYTPDCAFGGPRCPGCPLSPEPEAVSA